MGEHEHATAPVGGMTVAEAGRRGGNAVKDKYGPDYYSEIGKKGGQASRRSRSGRSESDTGG